eukprot:406615_1
MLHSSAPLYLLQSTTKHFTFIMMSNCSKINGCLLFIALQLMPTRSIIMSYNNSVTNINAPLILNTDDRIQHSSTNAVTYLKMQNDGNFVLRWDDGSNKTSLFSAKTNNEQDTNYAQLLSNGNLQVMDSTSTLLWESGTTGHDNGHPHTFVVAKKCAYIMDRDNNIFWTSSMDPLYDQGSNCSAYPLDLVIHKSTETQPSAISWTPLYGDQSPNNPDTWQNAVYDGSYWTKIDAIYDWGITKGNKTSGKYNNTLYIKDWQSDIGLDGLQPVPCDPFVLNDNDYIIGYRMYDSVDYIHGIIFYTSLGCSYACLGDATSGERGGVSITDRGIVSYYYGVNMFWFLAGFNGYFTSVVHSLQFEIIVFPSSTNLSTSDTLMCDLTSAPTLDPTSQPTSNPTHITLGPTLQTLLPTRHTVIPTLVPSSLPTNAPVVPPTFHPTYIPTLIPTNIQTQDPTRRPSNDSTHNITPSHTQKIYDTITTAARSTRTSNDDPNTLRKSSNDDTIYIVSAVVGVCLLCVLVMVFKLYRTKMAQRLREQVPKIKMSDLSIAQGINKADLSPAHIVKADAHDDVCILIMQWLTDVVKLPVYYEHFIKNGYDRMEFIKNIEDKSDLRKIGIKKAGHQTRIMSQIKVLSRQSSKGNVRDMMIRSDSETLTETRETEGNTNAEMEGSEGQKKLGTMPQVAAITMGESDESDVDMAVRKQFETDMGDATDGFMMEDVSIHSDDERCVDDELEMMKQKQTYGGFSSLNKCMHCGAETQQKMIEMGGVLVCMVCKMHDNYNGKPD